MSKIDHEVNRKMYFRYPSSHPAAHILGSYRRKILMTSLDFSMYLGKLEGTVMRDGQSFLAIKPVIYIRVI